MDFEFWRSRFNPVRRKGELVQAPPSPALQAGFYAQGWRVGQAKIKDVQAPRGIGEGTKKFKIKQILP